jgi:hypothetical protein
MFMTRRVAEIITISSVGILLGSASIGRVQVGLVFFVVQTRRNLRGILVQNFNLSQNELFQNTKSPLNLRSRRTQR